MIRVAPVAVILQARVESTRFPQKVLAPLLGQPMLLWQLAAVARMTTAHKLIVAAPETPANHALADLCAEHGTPCVLVPGDPNDVLARVRAVARQADCPEVVRLTGDCPLLCPDVVDGLIARARRVGTPGVLERPSWETVRRRQIADHVGIALSWGDGLDAEMVTRNALAIADAEATMPSDREHVTPYLWRQPERFYCVTYPCPFDLSWLRLSVDTPEDLVMVATILAAVLDRVGLGYGWRDVWQVVERFPELKRQMLAKPHNPAYLAQQGPVPGAPPRDWGTLRYGGVPHL